MGLKTRALRTSMLFDLNLPLIYYTGSGDQGTHDVLYNEIRVHSPWKSGPGTNLTNRYAKSFKASQANVRPIKSLKFLPLSKWFLVFLNRTKVKTKLENFFQLFGSATFIIQTNTFIFIFLSILSIFIKFRPIVNAMAEGYIELLISKCGWESTFVTRFSCLIISPIAHNII